MDAIYPRDPGYEVVVRTPASACVAAMRTRTTGMAACRIGAGPRGPGPSGPNVAGAIAGLDAGRRNTLLTTIPSHCNPAAGLRPVSYRRMIDSPDSLFQRIADQARDELPPVHLWNPPDTKDIGMRVTRDGTWWYQGSPIRRPRMVRLFSRVLRRDGADYFLVTPAERVRVEVEVAPLLAVRMEVRRGGDGPDIAFQTNVGDVVIVDREHPIRMRGTRDAPLPLVVVRDEIEALIARNVYYELVEQGDVVDTGDGESLIVRSRGEDFELGTV